MSRGRRIVTATTTMSAIPIAAPTTSQMFNAFSLPALRRLPHTSAARVARTTPEPLTQMATLFGCAPDHAPPTLRALRGNADRHSRLVILRLASRHREQLDQPIAVQEFDWLALGELFRRSGKNPCRYEDASRCANLVYCAK